MNVFDLSATLKLDSSEYVNSLNNASNQAANFSGTASSSMLKTSTAFTVMQKVVETGLNAIRTSVSNAVSRVDTLNAYVTTMQNLGFSTQDAKKAQEELVNSIQNLPTALDSLIATQQQYTALTGDIDKATKLTIALNDATLAGGQGQEVANSAMQQWYQIIANGKPDLQSWKIINSAMPAQLNQIAEACLGAGAKSQDLFDAWQSGEVTTEQVEQALMDLDQNGGGSLASFAQQAEDANAGIQTALDNMKIAISKSIAGIFEEVGIENITGVINGITNGIYAIGEAAGTAAKFLMEHKDQVIALGVVLGSLAVGMGVYNTVQAAKIALNVAETASLGELIIAQIASTAATIAAAAPYLLVAAAIGALIAIIVLCVKHWDEIKAKVIEVATHIKESIQTMVASVVNKFNEMKQKMVDIAKNIFNGIKNAFSNIVDVGKNIISGLWNGASGMISWAVSKFKSLGKSILNGIKSVLGIKSPSKEFAKVGLYSVMGLAEGIEDNAGMVSDAMDSVANRMTEPDLSASLSAVGTSTANTLSVNIANELLSALQNVTIDNQLIIDKQTIARSISPVINNQLGRQQVLSARGV